MGPTGFGYSRQPLDDHGRPLAEWWQRFTALLIDLAVLFVPSQILFFTAGNALAPVLYLGLHSAYFGLLNGGDKGQTLGKRALRIQVRDSTSGGTLGPERAAVRYLIDGVAVFLPPLLLFDLLDCLWPLWDPKRQALHDKLVNSVVIKTEAERPYE